MQVLINISEAEIGKMDISVEELAAVVKRQLGALSLANGQSVCVQDIEVAVRELQRTAIAYAADEVAATEEVHTCSITSQPRSHAIAKGYGSSAVAADCFSLATTHGDEAHAMCSKLQSTSTAFGRASHAVTASYLSHARTIDMFSNAVAIGGRSAASTCSKDSVSIATGPDASVAKAGVGGFLVLAHWDKVTHEIVHLKAAKVGKDGVKPDVWYSLDARGKFVVAPDPVNVNSSMEELGKGMGRFALQSQMSTVDES